MLHTNIFIIDISNKYICNNEYKQQFINKIVSNINEN